MTTPQDPQSGQDPKAQGSAAQGKGDDQQGGGIPAVVLEKYPDLVALIKKTESMSDEEREYWYQILPIMTDDQVERLRKILTEEAEQLAKLDKDYQDELSDMNKKHAKEWDAFEKQKEREQREKAESAHEADEKADEAALLDQLDEI